MIYTRRWNTQVARRLAAILAADVVGYSLLMGKDEVGTLARLNALRKELVQPRITDRKGRIVKLHGRWAHWPRFPSVIEAVECASSIQKSMTKCQADQPVEQRIKLRIGINLGESIVEGSDIFGDGVNVAARLEGLAEPGGICISGQAFDAVEGKLDFAFEDLGPQQIKTLPNPCAPIGWAERAIKNAHWFARPNRFNFPASHPSRCCHSPTCRATRRTSFSQTASLEDIITALSKLSKLFIITRNSTFTYKGKKRWTSVGRAGAGRALRP